MVDGQVERYGAVASGGIGEILNIVSTIDVGDAIHGNCIAGSLADT